MSGQLPKVEEKLGFDRVRRMVQDRCMTDYAADKVRSELISTDPSEISRRILLTDEMRLILMFEETFPTTGYVDCLPFLLPLEESGTISLLSLGKLKTLLETVRKATAFFRGIKDGIYPGLKRFSSRVADFPEVQSRIELILDKTGQVRDSASPGLQEIRRELKDKEGQVSKRMNAILRKAQQDGIADADAGVAMRDGKMLIPVHSARKKSLPGFVYDESTTGKTTFIEPAEIVELTNEIAGLRFAEAREIAKILSEFTDFLRPYIPEIADSASYIGELDFIMAKAQVSLDMIAGAPLLSEGGEMNLRKARHPLLEKALRKEGREIVPLSLTLTPSKRILLISGPNAGGKSVCLKTVGLLQYMFQWGMLIPTSETSELPVFNRIMVSIGDDQSIDNDLSTYSSFLEDMKETLLKADDKTLVLIDEFGSGTEPAAGGAIAEAILSSLEARGSYGVITTHYTNLKLYASSPESAVINGAMLFDTENITPLFKLETGVPGSSFAFALARKIGIPEAVVKDAEARAGEEYVGIEKNLRRIARNRKVLDERLHKVKAADKALESITDRYQKELEDIRALRKGILDEARREAEEIVKGANRQVENTIRTIREAQAEKTATKEAREELGRFIGALGEKKEGEGRSRDAYLEKKIRDLEQRRERENEKRRRRSGEAAPPPVEDNKLEAFRSSPVSVGEKVRIKDSGLVGEVIQVSQKAVVVATGNITTKISRDRVEKVTSNEYRSAIKEISRPPLIRRDEALEERKLAFRPEIDVRGERVADAIEKVTRYIDDAIMLNVPSVRILHGKGTGALHEEIQKYLRTIPAISSVRDEHIQLGGSGVTIVEF